MGARLLYLGREQYRSVLSRRSDSLFLAVKLLCIEFMFDTSVLNGRYLPVDTDRAIFSRGQKHNGRE